MRGQTWGAALCTRHSHPQVHVLHTELGAPEPLPIRGSPFTITASNAWVPLRTGGAVPAKRKGATLAAVGKELVSEGHTRKLVAVAARRCHTASK